MADKCRTDLSEAGKTALVILLEDGMVAREVHCWRGSSGRGILLRTILALYDRYLIKIVVESRHRRRQMATLTDVGEYAARAIRLDLQASPHQSFPVSHDAALLIAEATS